MGKISKGEQSKIIKAFETHPIGDFDTIELEEWHERIINSMPQWPNKKYGKSNKRTRL